MNNNKTSNRTLAKNSMFLYFRMFLTLIVGLYTSRVILNALGVSDYGIYNVVGGIVAIFVSLNSAMASTSSRYVSYYIGEGNGVKLKKIFSTIALIHIAIAVFVILLCETIGVWFFHNYMNIPNDRVDVAFLLLQLSFAASFFSMINIPYTALIIGHEKMNIYAYISIFDSVMKLVIAYLITISPIDKLLFYGVLVFIVQFIDFVIYRLYSNEKFKESKICFSFEKDLIKELVSYCGWSLIGNIAMVASTQGVNLLLNMFFGPIVNAARGIAVQLQNIVTQFVSNFQIALNPQIIKSYSTNDLNRTNILIYASAKYGFYLIFVIALPLVIEAEWILKLWLGVVPEHTVAFIRIILIICMLDTISNPLIVAAGATGKIRMYSIIVGGLMLLIVPISYILLKSLKIPEIVFIVHLIMVIIALISRLLIVSRLMSFSVRRYVKKVLFPIFYVSLTSLIIPISLSLIANQSILDLFLVITISIISTLITIYVVGLNKEEQSFILATIRSKVLRK